MKVLIDTNIILDVLLNRQPFFEYSKAVMEYCKSSAIQGYIAAHSITNLFFILRKLFTEDERRKILINLCEFIQIVEINENNILSALKNYCFKDFEDCLQAECAASCGAEYIVTRNIEDFLSSPVPPIAPGELAKKAEAL